MSLLAELDRDKIVDLDFTSAEFRRNAHRLVAGWARRPPFYVLGNGPPQVIVGRYADVHEVFSDPERFASKLPKGPGFEQYDKFMGFEFMTQMDGEQHARLRSLVTQIELARTTLEAADQTARLSRQRDARRNGHDFRHDRDMRV